MKRLAVLACAASLTVAGCNSTISPVTPTGVRTLAAVLSGAQNVPPAGSLEAGTTGTVQIVMTPAAGGGYTATFNISLTGLVRAGLLAAPLDNGSVIVAGYIHQGSAGALGSPVVPLPISQTVPLLSPTGNLSVTISNVAVSAAAASGMLATPSAFYFNLYSAINQNGVARGQLVLQQ